MSEYKLKIEKGIAVELKDLTYEQYLDVCKRFTDAGFKFFSCSCQRKAYNYQDTPFVKIDQDGDIIHGDFDNPVYTYDQIMEKVEGRSSAPTVVDNIPSNSWNIRHFREDKHVSKGAYSLTVLYRQVDKHRYEYKIAICNPKDEFNRQKGVEAAKAKDSGFVYANEKLPVGDILVHFVLSNVKYGSKLHNFLLSLIDNPLL